MNSPVPNKISKNSNNKKVKLDNGSSNSSSLPLLALNPKLNDEEFLSQMQKAWHEDLEFKDKDGLRVSSNPFSHLEIPEFVADEKFMKAFYKLVSTEINYTYKASDLLAFNQSDDLTTNTSQALKSIRTMLETRFLDILLKITNFPLNGKVDMFLSKYEHTNFLLCHDDELESRRIAFILYLSPEWGADYGGSLDLFDSTEDISPGEIVKSITPVFNKFVFFTVTCKSFHQVAEVTKPGAQRYALSGWFYGEAIPRPHISLPEVEYYTPDVSPFKEEISDYVTEAYMNEETHKTINEQLMKDSDALLFDFMKPLQFKRILEHLNQLKWEMEGPANVRRYFIATDAKLWPLDSSLCDPINALSAFFHSSDFFSLMEKITEFKFNQAESVTSSLRKFDKTCYTLIVSSETDPGKSGTNEDHPFDDEGEDEDDDDGYFEVDGNGSEDNDGDDASDDKIEAEGNGNGADDDNDSHDSEDDELTFIDLMYFCAGPEFQWEENWGGLTIYTGEDGEQLSTVTPVRNSLAIVIRNKSVKSHVNYINSLATNSYFVYTVTFAFRNENDDQPEPDKSSS